MTTLQAEFEAWFWALDPDERPELDDAWLAYQAATERAAKKCEAEALHEVIDNETYRGYNVAIRHCAAAIRGDGGQG